jgi:hypothetical protein
MTRSDELNELATALAAAQGELTGAKKDAANPYFKSKYADLASIWDACREPLSHHGLSVAQFPRLVDSADGGWMVEIETMLLHSSGQWMSDFLRVPVVKGDPQGVGSAITYGRRYALAAVVGVAPEDDDGEAAVRHANVGRPVSVPTSIDRGDATKRSAAVAEESHAERIARLKAEAAAKRGEFKEAYPNVPAPGYDAPVPEDEMPPEDLPEESAAVTGEEYRIAGVRPVNGPAKTGETKPSWILYVVSFDRKVKASDGVMVSDASTLDEKLASAAIDAKDAKATVFPRVVPSEKKKGSYKLLGL